MSEVATSASPRGKTESSPVEHAKEKVQEAAGQAKGEAGDRLREQVETRSTQAGEQVKTVANAMRQTSERLRSDGSEAPAKVLEQVAGRAERLGSYLKESSADRILDDLESYARRQPWAVGAGAFVVGLLGSRFLKASSNRRYQPNSDGRSQASEGFGAPMYSTGPNPAQLEPGR